MQIDRKISILQKGDLKMAKQKSKAIIAFGEKVAQMALETGETAYLKALVQMTRGFETTIARLEGFIKITKPKIRELMQGRHANDPFPEERFGQTFVKLSYSLGLGEDIDDEKNAHEKYLGLCEMFGEDFVKEIVEITKTEVPKTAKTKYSLSPEALETLKETGRFKIFSKFLKNQPSVTVGPVPKRVKKGKNRVVNTEKRRKNG